MVLFEGYHAEMIFLVGMMLVASILLIVMTVRYWNFRHQPSGKAFISVLFLCAMWSFFASLKILATDQSVKMTFQGLEYLIISLIPITVLWTVIKFYERHDLGIKKLFAVLIVIPIICIIGLLTNDIYHLFFVESEISMYDGTAVLTSTYGPLFILNEVYSYFLIFFALVVIAWHMRAAEGTYKKRDLFVIIGISLPFIGDAAFMFGISPYPGISYAPVLLGAMAIILMFAFLRYRLFDLAPIARKIVWDNNPDPFIVINEKKIIVDLNSKACSILDLDRSNSIGRPVNEVLSSYPQVLELCLLTENTVKELKIVKQDARLFFESQTIILKAKDVKRIVGILVILRDITLKKEMDDALYQSELKYRLLMEHAPFPIIILRVSDEKIMLINNKMEKLLKVDRENIIDQPIDDFLASTEELDQLRMKIKEEGMVTEFETVLVNRKKERFWAYLSALKIELGNETVLMVVVNDISDRKMAEALKIANRKLNLLSGITRHDLLNKFVIIAGYLQILEKVEDEEKFQEIIKKLEMNTAGAQELIKFTSEYENLGASAPVWQNVEEIVFKARGHFELTRINTTFSTKNLQIYGDAMLEKVFYNLMDNSIRHGENVKNIDISYVLNDDRTLSIIYQDDGIGLSPEEKRTLFKQGVGKNTGQGMFLTKEILQITGLGISENGVFGKGARFEISVPADIFNIITTS
jgi:PAS domain S-box-containing protein